ncbi:hypothetical protein LCGC14_0777740 [marine sediment metagenome]|uniref:Uncharacterized protein n=1 Tax=marine sediment metagenome TaxID=412755 RepID=A0A0F9PWM7_9ZZZZ
MSWKLSRWKPCDGGCAVRSPTFPDETNKGTVLGRHEDYMAGDRYKLSDIGGTNPDGFEWTGGNLLHKELWALYESVGRNAKRLRLADLKALPGFGQLFGLNWPLQGLWKGNAIQWFLDRDFGWPVRGVHVQAILDQMAKLGLWDSALYDPGLDYTTVYSDEEREALGQTFHVTDKMTQTEKETEEPACCHFWEKVP